MAQVKKTIEIEAIAKDALQQINKLTKQVEGLEKQLNDTNKSTKKVAKGISFIGKSLKAAGVGLAIAAFAKLTEVFNQNQKATNFFNTTFEALSLAFNDFFNFLDANVGTVIDYFKGIFDDPVGSIKNLGVAIAENIVERFRSAIDSIGHLGKALVKVFEGDFAGAVESVKDAAKESVDIFTGVDNTFEKAAETLPTVVKGIAEYTKSTVKAAQETVELNRAAEIGIAQNRIILEQKDREAEKLRQIRDDESKTIEERIKANNDLAAVLDEQEKLMLANADAVIAAAQAQFDKNQNDENRIALLDAQAEKEGILAQIEGFRSEQISNRLSLEREVEDMEKEAHEAKLEREEELLEAKEKQRQAVKDNLDAIIEAAGEETAIGRALFIAKQAMLIKEQIAEAKATLGRVTMRAAESSTALNAGTANTAKVGFPQNIPLLIAFAAQAAGIFASIKSAVGAAKSSASKLGASGGGSVSSAPTPSQAPAFNIVGAAPENQLAQAIGDRENRPMKAYVVSNEVTNAQALDRNIVETASIG